MSGKTKIEFKLSKTGPCTVYSSDLEGSADVVYGKIPLTILTEGHKLELVATATLGLGIQHAKHVPGLCYYHHLFSVKSSSEIDKIVQSSKGKIKPEKKGSKWLCDLSDADEESIIKIDKDAIEDSDELIMVIESFGMMPAVEIFEKAIKTLESNLEEFEKALK